jgi:uncharacterized protein
MNARPAPPPRDRGERSAACPRFVVIAGPPCSGKSTVAHHLAQALGAPHLEVDAFRQRLLPDSDQRLEHRDIAYRAMHLAAELLGRWCSTTVLDATYATEPCRVAVADLVERTGDTLTLVECHVDPEVAVGRLAARGSHPAVDLTPERVAVLAATYPYSDEAYAIDTSRMPDAFEAARHALTCLDSARPAFDLWAWCRKGLPRVSAPSREAPP